jgi:hypothetical protein
MSGLLRQIVRLPVVSLGSTLVWGVLEFLALRRVRRTTQDSRTPGSGNGFHARNPPPHRDDRSSFCKR